MAFSVAGQNRPEKDLALSLVLWGGPEVLLSRPLLSNTSFDLLSSQSAALVITGAKPSTRVRVRGYGLDYFTVGRAAWRRGALRKRAPSSKGVLLTRGIIVYILIADPGSFHLGAPRNRGF